MKKVLVHCYFAVILVALVTNCIQNLVIKKNSTKQRETINKQYLVIKGCYSELNSVENLLSERLNVSKH